MDEEKPEPQKAMSLILDAFSTVGWPANGKPFPVRMGFKSKPDPQAKPEPLNAGTSTKEGDSSNMDLETILARFEKSLTNSLKQLFKGKDTQMDEETTNQEQGQEAEPAAEAEAVKKELTPEDIQMINSLIDERIEAALAPINEAIEALKAGASEAQESVDEVKKSIAANAAAVKKMADTVPAGTGGNGATPETETKKSLFAGTFLENYSK